MEPGKWYRILNVKEKLEVDKDYLCIINAENFAGVICVLFWSADGWAGVISSAGHPEKNAREFDKERDLVLFVMDIPEVIND